MAFSWVEFLDDHHIDYVTQGPNVARGHVNIACPLCGDDPSHHMGLNLASGRWYCWRDEAHRGRDPAYLIATLLGCSREAARKIAADEERAVSDSWSDLRTRLAAIGQDAPSNPPGEELTFPEEFRLAEKSAPFLSYLEARGYKHPDDVARFYGLRGALSGDYRYRLIIPFFRGKKLVGWTGRAIGEAIVRYKSLILPEVRSSYVYEPVPGNTHGLILAVCEGPLDALKLDFFGGGTLRAVALLGLNLTPGKIETLDRIARPFNEVRIFLDAGETATSLRFLSALSVLRTPVRLGSLPDRVKDPGDLTAQQVRKLANSLLL